MELQEVQQAGANLLQERDNLAEHVATIEGRFSKLTSEHESLQCVWPLLIPAAAMPLDIDMCTMI